MSPRAKRIIVLPRATREIAEQGDYYAHEATTAVAARWRASVVKAIRSLRPFAERCERLQNEALVSQEIRKLRIDGFPSHVVLYRWDASTRSVLILSVVHGARDLENLGLE